VQTVTAPKPEVALPGWLIVEAPQVQRLRYGENPHQLAGLYGRFHDYFTPLHGKELSYNNILDLTAAARLISQFAQDPPTLAILKHMNPCGVGQGNNLREAWDKAYETDRQAPFGGIIAVNQKLDEAGAEAIAGIFSEVVAAPDFEPGALALLRRKTDLRVVRLLRPLLDQPGFEVRSVGAESFLLQEWDTRDLDAAELQIVTQRQPTPEELRAMLFGWRVVKQVKSNAIVFVHADRTLGVGAGQMSRVDACRLAAWKAGEAGLPLLGSTVASDAFFPFPDGVMAASDAGATAVIQPGGSKRDAEVIAAANERNLAMAFTGARHFRH